VLGRAARRACAHVGDGLGRWVLGRAVLGWVRGLGELGRFRGLGRFGPWLVDSI